MSAPKIKIAWYSFACCEDSTIMFAELLNDYFFEFKEHFDIIDASVLSSKRDLKSPLDIVFIEGASVSEEHDRHMQELRNRAKIVVAIGSCACTGMPSAQRNQFDADQLAEIQHVIDKFNYAPKVKKLAEVIKVDAEVPGCPMDLNNFMTAVNGLLVQHGHEPIVLKGQ